MPEPGKLKRKKPHRFYDYSLLLTIIFLTVFGLIMIYSASSIRRSLITAIRDILCFVGGRRGCQLCCDVYRLQDRLSLVCAVCDAGIYRFIRRRFRRRVLHLGVASHGKKRWLRPGTSQFQPTEIVKISLILLLAVLGIPPIWACGSTSCGQSDLSGAVGRWHFITANNLSSGIIICGIVFVMLFVACKIKWPFFSASEAASDFWRSPL